MFELSWTIILYSVIMSEKLWQDKYWSHLHGGGEIQTQ